MRPGGPKTSDGTSCVEPTEDFTVPTSLLLACYCLEDLVLELLFKRQEDLLELDGESTEYHKRPADVLRIEARREMESVVQELPAMRRYAIVGIGTSIMRRNPGQL
jgi:hypothetical protein